MKHPGNAVFGSDFIELLAIVWLSGRGVFSVVRDVINLNKEQWHGLATSFERVALIWWWTCS